MTPLLEDRQASLVLLAAPAGYGKTSTLSEWAELDPRPFAWVTLREEDNDPRCLLTSIALAVTQLHDVEGRLAPRSRARVRGEAVLPCVESLRSASNGSVLVLDDLQAVSSSESLEVLSTLSAGLGPSAKLVLASRTEPALLLSRLRAQHELLELGVHELAMTTSEAAALVESAGLALAPEQLETLMQLTEGWPAILYLAAIAVRDDTGVDAALERLAGDDELISRYVREEVLAQAPGPASLRFLLDTSILEDLSGELCDAVLHAPGSGLALRSVAAGNLLVTPTDRSHRRYRCHPLLRHALHAELVRMDPDRERQLHRAAARWLGEHGQPGQAAFHAAAGGDLQHVGEVLWAHAPRTIFQGGQASLEIHLDRLSTDQTAGVPTLSLLAAHRSLFEGDLRRAAHWTHIAAEAAARDDAPSLIPGFAAAVAVAEAALAPDGPAAMSTAAARGRELAREGSPWQVASCLLGGVAERLLGGERSRVRDLLEEGASSGALEFPGLQSQCLAQLALMAAEEQDWDAAADLAERAVAALERADLSDHPSSALVRAVSAWVCAEQGRIDEAKRDHDRALHMLTVFDDFIPWFEVETRVLLARTAIHLADIAPARAQLSLASKVARRMPDVAVFSAWFDEAWGRIDGLSAEALGGPSSLTMAELRILRFLPTHLSFREIGTRLHVSTNTVKSQVHAVYRKLDAGSRSEAVARATSLGLIDSGI